MLSPAIYHVTVLLIFVIGLIGIINSKNLVQIILIIEMMLAGSNLVLLQAATRNGNDPLGHSAVIISTVIGAGLTAFLLAISIKVYRETGTLDINKIRSLRG